MAAVLLALAAPEAPAATPSRASAPTAEGDGPQIPKPDPPADDAGEQARRILDGDEYEGPGAGRSLGERIRDWIRRQLPDVDLGGRRPRLGNWWAWAVMALVLAGAGLAAGFALRRVRSGRRAGADGDVAGTVEVTPLRSPEEWAAEAERCEAQGEWRQAIRARYRALTGELAERRLVSDLPGRTAGEHRAELTAASPGATATFSTVVDAFERVWYGRAPAGPDDARRAKELAAAVLASVPDRPRPTEGDGAVPEPVHPISDGGQR